MYYSNFDDQPNRNVKTTVELKQTAVPKQITTGDPRPAVIAIDDQEFRSELPRGEAHAAAINVAAQRLVQQLSK